jgi:hypothetical protein
MSSKSCRYVTEHPIRELADEGRTEDTAASVLGLLVEEGRDSRHLSAAGFV